MATALAIRRRCWSNWATLFGDIRAFKSLETSFFEAEISNEKVKLKNLFWLRFSSWGARSLLPFRTFSHTCQCSLILLSDDCGLALSFPLIGQDYSVWLFLHFRTSLILEMAAVSHLLTLKRKRREASFVVRGRSRTRRRRRQRRAEETGWEGEQRKLGKTFVVTPLPKYLSHSLWHSLSYTLQTCT